MILIGHYESRHQILNEKVYSCKEQSRSYLCLPLLCPRAYGCSVTVSVAMTLYHARQAGLLALPLTTEHQSQVGVNPFSIVLPFLRFEFFKHPKQNKMAVILHQIRLYAPKLDILKSAFVRADHVRCP
jgi:hypothetical protein